MLRGIIKLTCNRSRTVRGFFSTSIPDQENNNSKTQSTTIDSAEIAHFKNLVDFWWNKNGKIKLLHTLNDLRIPFIHDEIRNRGLLTAEFINSPTPLKHLSILDIGCGGGILSEAIAALGADVTGIDACEEMIKCAKLHADGNPDLKNKIYYIFGAVEDIVDNNKNHFDVVVSSECIEHVASQETYLQSCVKVLKPGGSMLLTTINKTTTSWLFYIVAMENIFKQISKGTHDWDKFMTPHEIQEILANNNCQTKMIRGFTYNFIKKKWCWTSYSSINYALHAVKNI